MFRSDSEDDGPRPIQLEFVSDIRMVETVLAEQVGDGLCYLHETPLVGIESARFADVVQVEPTDEGYLRFVRVVERSPYRTWDWILTERLIQSPAFERLKARIMAEGGNWEHALGGVFICHLPPESTLDPEAEIDSIRAAAAPLSPAPGSWWRFGRRS